jgi:hypothetical protein
LLTERLQAWKHACKYLEGYISATEKSQKTHAKEYEKILKVAMKTAPPPVLFAKPGAIDCRRAVEGGQSL